MWGPAGPLDLRLTMAPLSRGPGDPTCRVGDGGVWWATRTAAGPATLHATAANGEVRAAAWGRGADLLLDRLPVLLGGCDRPDEFLPPPGPVSRLHRRHRGLRFCSTGAPFEALLPVIVEQKVTGKEARRSYLRLVTRHGEPAPGPGDLRLPPAPATLAALPYEDYHPLGIERKRAETIRAAARRAPRIDEIVTMGRDAAVARLRAFPGIGPWSAANVMQVAYGDPDAVAVGDYHLANLVAWNLAGEPRADDARMLELLAPYAGHRARVTRLLKLGGRSAPRYGPRVALRSIERI